MTHDLQLPEADTRLGAKRPAGEADLLTRLSSIAARDAGEGNGHHTDIDVPLLAERATDRPARSRLHNGGIDVSSPMRSVNGVRPAAEQDLRPNLSLQPAQLDQVGALFKLLCDRTRLAILQILCEGELNVTALCRRLKLPQPTVSHHLGLLRMNRLIANRRSGKQVYYSLHERVERAVLPREHASLDGVSVAGPGLAERASGLRIVDTGFTVQILTPGGDTSHSGL